MWMTHAENGDTREELSTGVCVVHLHALGTQGIESALLLHIDKPSPPPPCSRVCGTMC